uniref:Photosystem I reaction center subunit IX n=2 Tax=Isoetes TaxID=13838 RepID=A0A343UR64_9TRAC|nr:photosystem I subunit IX [Isoetes cangae]YP_009515255.1 photosystem I subunit IX [Isoetes serracarajensis]AVH79999.1 photosystem I subunit IX [Isoetes cangae]AVH80082.1 photosystem I subunit IX [Isoetes cangae]AVH80165.1 photosystem I subunit IX [Isoetes serracarajensis]
MQDVKTYLSTAPVVATLWFGSSAGLLTEINRSSPDALVLSLPQEYPFTISS